MMQRAARLPAVPSVIGVTRSHLYFVRLVAVGLIAVGVSGCVCWGIRSRFGDDALAAGTMSAHLSDDRCADLFEYQPASIDCAHAEIAHHADEIVAYRFTAGIVGVLAIAAYFVACQLLKPEVEDAGGRQRRAYRLLAVVSFGAAALVLLAIGSGVAARDPSNAAPRWFADGGVSLAFFVVHAVASRRTLPLI